MTLVQATSINAVSAARSVSETAPRVEKGRWRGEDPLQGLTRDAEYLERARAYHAAEHYAKAMRKPRVWVEPLVAEAKDWHGPRRFRPRGLEKVNGEALLIAAGQNHKRLLSWRGWGRRPFPSRAASVALPFLRPTLAPNS